MLRVELANRWGRHGTLGPNRVLKLEGAAIKLGRKQEEVGEHIGDGWQVGDRMMTRLEVHGPLTIRFESEGSSSAAAGPYDFVLIVNDYIFTTDGLLACFSREQHQWQLIDSGQFWPRMVLEALSILSADQRHTLISEAAYRLAEARGFTPGQELDDWLAAEREVNERLSTEALQTKNPARSKLR
jgi:hypothetical protein